MTRCNTGFLRNRNRWYHVAAVSGMVAVFCLLAVLGVSLYYGGNGNGHSSADLDKYTVKDRKVAQFYDLTHGWCSRKDLEFWSDNAMYCACVSAICDYDKDRPHKLSYVDCANDCVCKLEEEHIEQMRDTLDVMDIEDVSEHYEVLEYIRDTKCTNTEAQEE